MNVIYLDQYRKSKMLVAAADRHIAETLCEFFLTNQFKVEHVNTLDNIIPVLSKRGADIVLLTTFGMASSQIPPLITSIKEAFPGIGITVLSGDDSIQAAVIEKGADVFMLAPFCFKDLLGRIKTILAVK